MDFNKFLIAREISWLSFNARVLQEASDSTLNLKERIRFLGIYSNNRDEFFRVKLSALKKFNTKKRYYGKNPQKILDQIHRIILKQQNDFDIIWDRIIKELKKKKVFLVDDKHLDDKQKEFVKDIFDKEFASSINPLFIENISQFPSLGDNNIFLGIVLKKKNNRSLDRRFAIIEIPTKNHKRFVLLPSKHNEQNIILLEDVIRYNLPFIFSHLGYTLFEAHMFKVTRDAEMDIDASAMKTLVQKIEKGIKNRLKAPAFRFLFDKKMNKELLKILISKLNLSGNDSIIPGGPIRNFRDFMEFPAKLPDYVSLKSFKHPLLTKSLRISNVVMQQDILMQLPYHSFNSIIDLLREAAMDPDVKSIKITAYRLASQSKICNALINAARNGKRVHVILELRANFDEEANLQWKNKLEEGGVKVYLGIPNLKIHAKICVIERHMGSKVELYGFVGTGNLNEITAKTYIDHFLLTSNRDIMNDLNTIFKTLEYPGSNWKKNLRLVNTLLVSPVNMRKALFYMIEREIKSAKIGQPSKIIININSLSDILLINKLYDAAKAGVEIKLIVRGIFCAQFDQQKFPIPVTAISIVDELLEHSRIFYFYNNGNEDIYLSSADWMERNLDNRIEVGVKITDKSIKQELKHLLKLKLKDNVKARILDNELSNRFVSNNGKKVRSQKIIYNYLKHKKIK